MDAETWRLFEQLKQESENTIQRLKAIHREYIAKRDERDAAIEQVNEETFSKLKETRQAFLRNLMQSLAKREAAIKTGLEARANGTDDVAIFCKQFLKDWPAFPELPL